MAHYTPIPNNAPAVRATWNNPMGELDTAISTHDHNPGVADSGGSIDHAYLTNIGTNTHQAIDGHIGSTQNPHQTSLSQVASVGGNIVPEQVRADATEGYTYDTLLTTSTLTNNLNRIRYIISQTTGLAWGYTPPRSITTHTHNPDVASDGGVVVQHGIEYDASEQATPTGYVSANPSIMDNLGHIRYDINQLKAGIGFADQSITSAHIQNGSLTTIDFEDHSVTEDIVDWGAITSRHLKAVRPSARSTDTLKSLVIDVEAGVYFLGTQTAVVAGQQTYSFDGILPTVTDGARIDTLYMDDVGQVLRVAGTPGTNPTAPDAPDDTLPLVQIYLKGVASTTATGIYNTNTDLGFSPNDHYIYKDIRPFLNLGGTGGGGGTLSSVWEPVIDEVPNETPNSAITAFTVDATYIANTTQVTVDGTVYKRVASAPGAGEYYESSATGITFNPAPTTGVAIRVSYFKGTSNPIANMVWSSTPTGTINGSNLAFTTADTFIIGTLVVYKAANSTAVMDRMIAGTHFTENTGGTGFTFTGGNAPATGEVLRVQYAKSAFATNNAATVGGFPASATATANTILALNASSELATNVTGTAVALANSGTPASPYYPSATPVAGQIPVVNGASNIVLPGNIYLPIAGSYAILKNASDAGNNPSITTAGLASATKLYIIGGTGGTEFRNNANSSTLLSISNIGAITFSAGFVVPNGVNVLFTNTTGASWATVKMSTNNELQFNGGVNGWLFRNAANTTNVVSITDAGAITAVGVTATTGTFGASTFSSTVAVTGAVTMASTLAVTGTLTAQAASGSVAGLMSTSHYNLLNAATSAATASTVALRDGTGSLTAASFIMNTNAFLSSSPYAVVGRVASGTPTLSTYNPAYVSVGYATALDTGADRTKLDSIDQTAATEANGWLVTYMPNGKRTWTKEWVNQALGSPTASPAALVTVTAPSGFTWNNVNMNYSVFSGGDQIVWGLTVGTAPGTGNGSGGTTAQLVGRTISGSTLTTYTAAYSLYMVLHER